MAGHVDLKAMAPRRARKGRPYLVAESYFRRASILISRFSGILNVSFLRIIKAEENQTFFGMFPTRSTQPGLAM